MLYGARLLDQTAEMVEAIVVGKKLHDRLDIIGPVLPCRKGIVPLPLRTRNQRARQRANVDIGGWTER